MIRREVEAGASLIARWSSGGPPGEQAERAVEVAILPFTAA